MHNIIFSEKKYKTCILENKNIMFAENISDILLKA